MRYKLTAAFEDERGLECNASVGGDKLAEVFYRLSQSISPDRPTTPLAWGLVSHGAGLASLIAPMLHARRETLAFWMETDVADADDLIDFHSVTQALTRCPDLRADCEGHVAWASAQIEVLKQSGAWNPSGQVDRK